MIDRADRTDSTDSTDRTDRGGCIGGALTCGAMARAWCGVVRRGG